ncbi:hypothetical protein KCU64_g3577, partial [Aureobasidium melanogenum]
MPSPYSTQRSELCCHDSFRVGCFSCKQDDIGEACAELEIEIAMTNEYLCALPPSISQAPTEEERQKLEKEEGKVKARHDSLLDCLSSFRKMMDKVAGDVRDICAKTEPHMLAGAFEKDAAARELEMDDEFRKMFGRDPPKSIAADPELEREIESSASTFKGLDLTNIPATPDVLLGSPAGLELMLRAGKNPMLAMGPNPGPAVMSYGRALAMFGPPESHTESTPKTEREYRERGTLNPPTVAILSEEEQLALFTEDKCLNYTEMLVSEYSRRVKAKKNVIKAEITDSYDKEESSTGGWPDVEGHDWAGLTNWIHRCMERDDKFFEVTLPSWKKQREDQSATMIERLSKWNLSDAVAAGFDDGSSRYGNPRKYWPYSKSLGEMEAEKALKHE